jgi:choline dehydrogenase
MEIHANMLTDPRDLAALRRSMEITRELGNSEAMKPFVKREPATRARAVSATPTSSDGATATAKTRRQRGSILDADRGSNLGVD